MKKSALCVAMFVATSAATGVLAEQPSHGVRKTEPEKVEAPAFAAPAITFSREKGMTRIEVEGLGRDQVDRIHWGEDDVTEALDRAITNGWASLTPTPTGFELEIEDPASLGLGGEGLFTLNLTTGAALSAYAPDQSTAYAAASCITTSFSAPTTNAMTYGCGYGSTRCGKAGSYHTGIDYGYSSTNSSARAVAAGKVVRVEKMSSSDHGMGTNVILEHTLADCSKIYSTYSHLASSDSTMVVGASVVRGQKVGTIGGSGYGNASYWGKHLHLEMKRKAVTSTPWSHASTCLYGCWGYTPYPPDNYGYKNPRTWY